MESTRLVQRSQEKGHPCIWMQAGVVSLRFCRISYQCTSCHFDWVMQCIADENRRLAKEGKFAKSKRRKIISWKEKLRARPPSKRPCIHHMKGRIKFKPCTNEYRCANCDFDQYFQDQYAVHAVVHPVNVFEIEGFRVPQGYYFHPGHTWIKVEEGSIVRIGVDEFALRLLGPLDSIKAPLMGKEVQQDRPDMELFRGSHYAQVLSPVSGVITATNPKLREEGSLANRAPYSEGWVMSVYSESLREDLKNLMINRETRDFMERQVERLHQVIEDVAGPLAADGGFLGEDIYGNMPQLGWKNLTKIFLNT